MTDAGQVARADLRRRRTGGAIRVISNKGTVNPEARMDADSGTGVARIRPTRCIALVITETTIISDWVEGTKQAMANVAMATNSMDGADIVYGGPEPVRIGLLARGQRAPTNSCIALVRMQPIVTKRSSIWIRKGLR